ncbi:AMP-binding protein [Cutibacterium equinum]|uniref:AMP-binding protein n=1 Tax=Cutibacterium equinum TaxID=3016342 RepID=A0ABY7R246_9ACTN|nr:AMP-binding protein [Cutibacterium equinum]WCC80657.1 AMP-binding protein [Cutibacterium equinum]
MAETARLHVVRVERTQADVDWLTERLRKFLHGSTRSVLVPAGGEENLVATLENIERRTVFLPDEVGLVLRTSGSTSAHGRLVGISASQLLASINATDARLGGAGTWVLALPPHHIAGLQVVARAAVGDRSVVVVEGKVTPGALAEAIDAAVQKDPKDRVYLSLVPTQLTDCMGDPVARVALARCAAILVGGAAASPELVAEARAAGIPIVLTYGMSETCGGCVYDGVPLDGVQVSLDEDGRVSLSGPMVMSGYLDEGPTGQWYRTGDIAHWQDGRLVVDGRADDLIISGGLKISPGHVAHAVTSTGLAAECVVVGLPDERWGQVVTAVVTGCAEPHRVREAVDLPRQLRPQVVVTAEAIPMLAPGKVDRREVIRLAEQARAEGSAWTR